jgi:hypothetical protein
VDPANETRTVREIVRVYPARTLRVQTLDTALIDVNLGNGNHVHRFVKIDGLDRCLVPPRLRDVAFARMTLIMGGKRLLIETSDFSFEDFSFTGTFTARVFLDEGAVHYDPPGYVFPHGQDKKYLEINTFFRYIVTEGLDNRLVLAHLNGRPHPKIKEG